MAKGLQIIAKYGLPFAIRGGGRNPNTGFNNVNDGILISTSGLKHLSYNEKENIVEIGPGNSFISIYDFLEPYGVTIPGGQYNMILVNRLLKHTCN